MQVSSRNLKMDASSMVTRMNLPGSLTSDIKWFLPWFQRGAVAHALLGLCVIPAAARYRRGRFQSIVLADWMSYSPSHTTCKFRNRISPGVHARSQITGGNNPKFRGQLFQPVERSWLASVAGIFVLPHIHLHGKRVSRASAYGW